MDQTSTLKKDGIIEQFGKEITRMLFRPLGSPEEDGDFSRLFLELVQVIIDSNLTGDEAAEVFEELDLSIGNQEPHFWIRGAAVPIEKGITDHVKVMLSFRAERFFRERYRKQFENLDLPGRMEFVTKRLESLTIIQAAYGHKYVLAALEYLNDELEREYERRKKTVERRAVLAMRNRVSGDTDTSELIDAKAKDDDEIDKKRKSEGKLDFRQIMVLLSELIPEFENADNTKKGKFIAAISPYSAEKRIGDEFSYINRYTKVHAKMVKHWRNELKTTKRGRPKSNKYLKIDNPE